MGDSRILGKPFIIAVTTGSGSGSSDRHNAYPVGASLLAKAAPHAQQTFDVNAVAGLPRENRWQEVDGKRIILFRWGEHSPVYYAAVDSQDRVALIYPAAESEVFDYDRRTRVLSFVRGDTTYRILGDPQDKPQGMEVVIGGKTTALRLLPGPVEGSLERVRQALQDAR